MSSIRPSLLADQRDQDDWRRGLGLVLLCLLTSVWVHLTGFIVWQSFDRNAADNFVFELQPENPIMELTLVFNEPVTPLEIVSETGVGEGGTPAVEEAAAMDSEPVVDDGTMVASRAEDLPEVNGQAAASPLEASAESDDPTLVKPEPPIRVEGEAPEHKSYYTAIRRAVNNKWIIPPAARASFRPSRLTIDFTIGREGKLLGWVMITSTGSTALNHAGEEAIRSAAPFPPFPDDLKKFSQLDIRMHFDYKAQYLPRQAGP